MRDVSALYESQEGRQGPSILQRDGESAIVLGQEAQRTVLYLGEINDAQQAAWLKTLDVLDEHEQRSRELSLFPDDREIPEEAVDSLQGEVERVGTTEAARIRRPFTAAHLYILCRPLKEDGTCYHLRCLVQAATMLPPAIGFEIETAGFRRLYRSLPLQ